MTAGHTCTRVRIRGRVQGVWFRAWTKEKAEGLGLDGWVCNRTDGSVEAVFAGPDANVRAMIEACHEGPPLASVDDVVSESAEYSEAGEGGFRQLATA